MKDSIKKVLFMVYAGLQIAVNCKFLGLADNITPIVMIVAVFGLWIWLERPKKKVKRNPVRMYTVGRMN